MSSFRFGKSLPAEAQGLPVTQRISDVWSPVNGQRRPTPSFTCSAVAEKTPGLPAYASSWAKSRTRRCVEFATAVIALVLCAPLMVFAGLLVCLSSPGPVLFRQRRMGRNGNEFILFKFRSMRAGGWTGSAITVMGDTRITWAGRFLRRYKLDELPQFWNVLKGDMSLVGPRPKLPHHEGLHLPCRPGITGAATLAFRNEEQILLGIPEHELESFYNQFIKPTKARLDLEYMETATPLSDLQMLWRTVASCLSSPDDEWHREMKQTVAYSSTEGSIPESFAHLNGSEVDDLMTSAYSGSISVN
jgi:lipopolysaccharide/colanic/teichoic acid biosynthesis glycosyltransferase